MKKVVKILFAVIASIVFSGCNSLMNQESAESEENYGSITIGSGSSDRDIDVSTIKFAQAFVSGTGIAATDEPSSGLETVVDGVSTITIEKIPVGSSGVLKNAVITVYAFDADKQKISTICLRKVTDIQKGSNSNIVVNKASTALGNIFYNLHKSDKKISEISSSDMELISSKIDTSVEYGFIDAAQIAKDYISGDISSKSKDDYRLSSGSVQFFYYIADNFSVEVGDSNSTVKSGCKAGSVTVDGIAAGTWPLYVKDAGGNILESTTVTVKSNETKELGHLPCNGLVTGSLIVVPSAYTHIYSWSGISTADYPGDKLSSAGDYAYYYGSKVESAKFVICDDSGSTKLGSSGGKEGDGDHEITKAGVYIYDSSDNVTTLSFYEAPDVIDPVPTAVITGKGFVKPSESAEFSASGSTDMDGTITAYQWSVSGGATLSSTSTETVTVTFPSTEGTCSLTLKVQDNDGNWSKEVTKSVKVSDNQSSTVTADFRDESIYFLMPARFYDGDSGNNYHCSGENSATSSDDPAWRGDFKGLISKLDYIKALGFSAIWITPVVKNNSGLDYHGYHAQNFKQVDGRLCSDGVGYQQLINAAHAKGIKIIQDIVLNHTGPNGEEGLYNAHCGSEVWENGQNDGNSIYHHNGLCRSGQYDCYDAQIMTIDGDCPDLETENPTVDNYLIDAYNGYIDMGVDGFRIDTARHISRLTFNSTFIPAFTEHAAASKAVTARGSETPFYMFGEVCTRSASCWYHDLPGISTQFYTWKEEGEWASIWSNDTATNEANVLKHFNAQSISNQPTSDNAFLKNVNEYHAPDYSKSSNFNVIDFQMHWGFENASNAMNNSRQQNQYFNDATWNVVYVDSHDYAPDTCQKVRYTGGTDAWAENMDLMWTYRGIPCIFYGSEIEFQKGVTIDEGGNITLANSGRAYYGAHLEGNVTASDFGVYTADGEIKKTLESTLSQHLMQLNKIRRAIPALRKGQFSFDDISGGNNMCFRRRYVENDVDSFVLVAISTDCTFNNLPAGTYYDAVTGDTQTVAEGKSLSTKNCSGQGNMRVYVRLDGDPSVQSKLEAIAKTSSYLK